MSSLRGGKKILFVPSCSRTISGRISLLACPEFRALPVPQRLRWVIFDWWKERGIEARSPFRSAPGPVLNTTPLPKCLCWPPLWHSEEKKKRRQTADEPNLRIAASHPRGTSSPYVTLWKKLVTLVVSLPLSDSSVLVHRKPTKYFRIPRRVTSALNRCRSNLITPGSICNVLTWRPSSIMEIGLTLFS